MAKMTGRTDKEVAREGVITAIALGGLSSITVGTTIALAVNVLSLSNGWRIFLSLACAALCCVGCIYAGLFQGAAGNSSTRSTSGYTWVIGGSMLILALIALVSTLLAGWYGYHLIVGEQAWVIR